MKARVDKKLALPAVYAFALSRQGDRLAVIGRNVILTDPVNRTRLYTCLPVPHPSYAAFSPDGTRLAVKSTSGRIVLLATESGETVLDFMNQTDGEGASAAFSACGRYLVDASWSGKIIVRDTLCQLPDYRHTFAGEMIVGVLLSRDRATWVFVHQPRATSPTELVRPAYFTVWTWPLSEYRKLTVETQTCTAELSPDGKVLAVADDMQVRFLLVENGTVLESAPADGCKRIRWSPDGSRVAFVLQSSIAMHAFPGGERVYVFEHEFASDMVFGLDDSFIAIGGWTAGSVC